MDCRTTEDLAAGLGADYGELPVRADWGKFDLVLIGGDRQEDSRRAAEGPLAPRGNICTRLATPATPPAVSPVAASH